MRGRPEFPPLRPYDYEASARYPRNIEARLRRERQASLLQTLLPGRIDNASDLHAPILFEPDVRNGKQVGLSGLSYFMGFSPFLNWMKHLNSMFVERSVGGMVSGQAAFDAGLLDENGDLALPVDPDVTAWWGIWHAQSGNVGQDMGGETFRVWWEGTGTPIFDWVPGGLTVDGEGTGTITMGPGQDNARIYVPVDLLDPIQPSSVVIAQERYEAEVLTGGLFNPDWVEELRAFETVRLMDWWATNFSGIAEPDDLATEAYYQWGANPDDGGGPRGAVPLTVVARLADDTDCTIWLCLPHLASDALVTHVATFCRDNIDQVVKFEYSNEVWNGGFEQYGYAAAQGNAMFGSEGSEFGRAMMWYGYRSAEIMKIVRDVYGVGNRARWRGVMGAFTAVIASAESAVEGVSRWQLDGGTEALTDLFDEIAVTGYFGGTLDDAASISAIAKGASTVITSAGHGLTIGTRVIISMMDCGMPELDDVSAAITATTADTFTIGVNSTAFADFVPPTGGNPSPFWCLARLFDLMDLSEADDPTDPYKLFVDDLAQTVLTGTSPSGLMPPAGTLPMHTDEPFGWWTLHKDLAEAEGLALTAYEGGLHFVGNVFLNGWPDRNTVGNRLTDCLLDISHRPETAALYTAFHEAFVDIGGVEPSKFVEGGLCSRFGTWAGVRHWPCANDEDGDLDNPVWLATKASVLA